MSVCLSVMYLFCLSHHDSRCLVHTVDSYCVFVSFSVLSTILSLPKCGKGKPALVRRNTVDDKSELIACIENGNFAKAARIAAGSLNSLHLAWKSMQLWTFTYLKQGQYIHLQINLCNAACCNRSCCVYSWMSAGPVNIKIFTTVLTGELKAYFSLASSIQ